MRTLKNGKLLAICLAAVSLAAAAPGHASAHVSVCRGDPIIRLSNGKVLDLTISINDDAANIENVAYTVVLPPNVDVTGVTYTGGALADKETLTIARGNHGNDYDASYLAEDTQAPVGVTGQTKLIPSDSQSNGKVQSAVGNGHANATITTQISD